MGGTTTSDETQALMHRRLRDRNPLYRFRMFHDLRYKDVGKAYEDLFGVSLSLVQMQKLEGLDSQRNVAIKRPSKGPRLGSGRAIVRATYAAAVYQPPGVPEKINGVVLDKLDDHLSFTVEELVADYFAWWHLREAILEEVYMDNKIINLECAEAAVQKLRSAEETYCFGKRVDNMFANSSNWHYAKKRRLFFKRGWE